MPTPIVPDSVEELTAQWLSEALSTDREPLVVDTVTRRPVELGSGFLSTMARLDLTYSGRPGPASVIVKLPADDFGARQVGELLNVWAREARFYDELVTHLDADVDVPECWYAAVDGQRGVVVIEDLSHGNVVEQVGGASEHDAHTVVDALARLQARWWGSRRGDLPEWVTGIHRDGTGVGLAASMERNFDAFDARYGEVLPTESMGWTRAFIPRVPAWLSGLNERPTTLAHADLHLGNLVFGTGADRPSVCIVDWQTAMVTGGVTDLSFFLGTALPSDVRRAVEGALVDRYIEQLERHGVPSHELTSVREDYATSYLWWTSMLSNNLAHLEPPDETTARQLSSMVERLHAAAVDLDSHERAMRQLAD